MPRLYFVSFKISCPLKLKCFSEPPVKIMIVFKHVSWMHPIWSVKQPIGTQTVTQSAQHMNAWLCLLTPVILNHIKMWVSSMMQRLFVHLSNCIVLMKKLFCFDHKTYLNIVLLRNIIGRYRVTTDIDMHLM